MGGGTWDRSYLICHLQRTPLSQGNQITVWSILVLVIAIFRIRSSLYIIWGKTKYTLDRLSLPWILCKQCIYWIPNLSYSETLSKKAPSTIMDLENCCNEASSNLELPQFLKRVKVCLHSLAVRHILVFFLNVSGWLIIWLPHPRCPGVLWMEGKVAPFVIGNNRNYMSLQKVKDYKKTTELMLFLYS